MLVKVISLFILVHCAFSQDSLLRPCPVEDIQCLSEATENFLDRTASGIRDYDIKAIDPLIIDMICKKERDDLMIHFKNVNITGLKKQKISNFKMDTVAKSVVLSIDVDVNIASNVEFEYEETKNKYPGTFSINGKAALTATYNYEIKANDKGVEYFEAGPETIACEFKIVSGNGINEELRNMILNDPHAKEIYEKDLPHLPSIKKKSACRIMEPAFAVVIHNLRTVAKLYPKTDFFTNV